MIRVIDYFETQLHVPSMKRGLKEDRFPSLSDIPSLDNSLYKDDAPPPGLIGRPKEMSDEQMVGWFSKVLDSVRLRYRKLQRFVRCEYVEYPRRLGRSLIKFNTLHAGF